MFACSNAAKLSALIACACLAPAARARAYSYASPLGAGCHEGLTLSALRVLRRDLDHARALPAGKEDRAWIADLPLDLPEDARDLATASLLVGVRDNDLKGHHGLDNSELAIVHGNPRTQDEHCLRAPEDDDPGGSERALRACRKYIRVQTRDAIERGLDANGAPDPDRRLRVAVHLALAGRQEIPAVLAWLQLGRAAHALQDSFSHALRSPDGLRVRGVLNWIDFASHSLIVRRDGPAHRRALDDCKSHDSVLVLRRQRAAEATHALLRAALTPGRDRDAALDAVLDRYLTFEPGCDASNGYCDAPELDYEPDSHGCAALTSPPRNAGRAWLSWLALAGWLLVRRRQRGRGAATARCALALTLAVLGPALARAEEPEGPADAATAVPAGRSFALAGGLGVAIDEAALAASTGARYRASERWYFGLDLEWNPWASLAAERVRPGSLNLYGNVIWRPYVNSVLALRVTGNLGASLLLFDLYGAPAGSLGPYVGVSMLGLELSLGRSVVLILEPADVRVPIPHLGPIPMSHRQYRATVSLEFWL